MIILLTALFLTGCSQNSSAFIYNPEKIDTVEIQGVDDSGAAIDFPPVKDPSKVDKVVGLIRNIKVRKLSPEEEMNILDYGKKMLEKGNYFVRLTNSNERDYRKSLSGMLIVLKEGKLIFFDIKTMTGKQRTVSYLPTEDQTETVKELLKIIESAGGGNAPGA
jgi:PBP1b-binding outer membrane lipoprotein LpoB